MSNKKTIIVNRRARHEYEIIEKFEAGISLLGTEVKGLREGKANLSEGWVDLRNGGVYLKDVHIGHYSHGNIMNHAEKRVRPLLLKKKEISKIRISTEQKGLLVIPLEFYFKKNWIKVEVATARVKKAHDKRETSKKRDADRQIHRALKNQK